MAYTFSSFDLNSTNSVTDWRRSLEEIYRGHTMHTYKRGQIIPMYPHTILRTKLARDRAVRAKFVEIRVRFNQGKV